MLLRMLAKQRVLIEYGLAAVILGLSVAGARLQNTWLLYVMIGLICVFIGLVVFDKVNKKVYPLAIFTIGLALLYQTTLIGPGLAGADIHGEYYFYFKALSGWDTSIPFAYNTSIGTTLIAPFLTNVFHIPGYWVYKAVFPLLFALVPLLLYFIFRKEFSPKTAFFAALFFIIVPTWSMEMIGLPRQMLGELMLVLCLFLILVSKWRLKIRVPLLVAIGTLGAMFHYVMGPVIVLYIGFGCLFLLFFKRRVFPVKWLSLVVVALLITGVVYYGSVAQGRALNCITGVSSNYITQVLPWIGERETEVAEAEIEGKAEESETTKEVEKPEAEETKVATGFFTSASPLIRAAWGLDFMDVGIWGKIFRIFQYLTQLSIVAGLVYLIRKRKRYSAEYLSLCGVAIFLLGCCMFIPRFAGVINATRMYHFTLLLLAPVFVLGGLSIFRKPQVLVLCLLIPYFLFTSGVIFEVSEQEDISGVNIPYSIALSHSRIDITEIPTANDIAVRDWAVSQNLGHMLTDIHGRLLFVEKVWLDWEIGEKDLQRRLENNTFEQGDFIFLSEGNNRTKTITSKPARSGVTTGMRISLSFAELGLDKVIENSTVIYRQGDAVILEIK